MKIKNLVAIILPCFDFTIHCCCCCCCNNKNTSTSSSIPGVGSELQSSIDNMVTIVNCQNGNRSNILCNKSILDNCTDPKIANIKKKAAKVIQYFNSNNLGTDLDKLLTKLLQRAVGSMLGMAVGDSRGAPYEFCNVNTNLYDANNYNNIDAIVPKKNKNCWTKDGQWTDDTSMGLCIADSLIVNKGNFVPLDIMRRFLAWWYCGYNNGFKNDKNNNKLSIGLGGSISKSFKTFLKNPTLEKANYKCKYISGNGSIMRNAPIPICFHNDLNTALLAAEKQSLLTHPGIEAAELCKLLTYIIIKIFNNEDKSLREILDGIKDFKTNVNSVKGLVNSSGKVASLADVGEFDNWNWKASKFEYNKKRAEGNPSYIGSYSMDNMAMSLHILYHTNSFQQAIEVATKLCGDADSVASVVGQIAGAYYSLKAIPKEWVRDILKWDDGDIITKALILTEIRN